MATTLDCLLHPIDCASVAASVQGARLTAAAQSAATSAGGTLTSIEAGATAPLHEVANTAQAAASYAMWVTIGIVVASIVFLIVFGYIVLKVV